MMAELVELCKGVFMIGIALSGMGVLVLAWLRWQEDETKSEPEPDDGQGWAEDEAWDSKRIVR